MKANETIEMKVKSLQAELARLEAFSAIVHKIEEDIHWEYCTIKYDENKNEVFDENGERIWIEPEEGSWGYDSYVARCKALEEIKKII